MGKNSRKNRKKQELKVSNQNSFFKDVLKTEDQAIKTDIPIKPSSSIEKHAATPIEAETKSIAETPAEDFIELSSDIVQEAKESAMPKRICAIS